MNDCESCSFYGLDLIEDNNILNTINFLNIQNIDESNVPQKQYINFIFVMLTNLFYFILN